MSKLVSERDGRPILILCGVEDYWMLSVEERNSLNESSPVKYGDEICAIYWINEHQLILYRKYGPYTVDFDDPLLAIPTDADLLAHRLMG